MSEISGTADLIADVREQILYLQELGVDSFDVELTPMVEDLLENDSAASSNFGSEIPSAMADRPSVLSAIADARSRISAFKPEDRPSMETQMPSGSRLSSLPTLASLSKRNTAPNDVIKNLNLEPTKGVVAGDKLSETIEQIRAEIGPDCQRCPLAFLGRHKIVNSGGNFSADLMFVGEAPGADEDEAGQPFVGRAGQLLTKIIEGIGLAREDVFIGNINRCRPPKNRAPLPEETAACKPFLMREIAVVRPKVIVVLGATAAQNLLETKEPIGKLRGHFHNYQGTKVMPTFHPAYLLRDPNKKREVWEDMKLVREELKNY